MAHSPHADGAAAAAAASGVFSKRGCCSFWIPWPSSVRGCKASWERIPCGEGGCPAASRRWWGRGLRALLKVGQASKAMASLRLTSLIRRLRRRGRPRHRRTFSYDALSYARNFDEGPQASCDSDVDGFRLGFSTRYASAHSPPSKPPVNLSPHVAGAAH